jgi:hypothetical protein
MKEFVQSFLERTLSRREFVTALAALGLGPAAIDTLVRGAEEARKVGSAETLEGTGGQILVKQMMSAGVKYVFTNPGSFEVGFFDALYARLLPFSEA